MSRTWFVLPTEVHGPDGDWTVRADRRGVPMRTTLLWGSADLISRLRRLVVRDHAWVVSVRRRADDPLGPAVHTETVASADEARRAVVQLSRALHDGTPLGGPAP